MNDTPKIKLENGFTCVNLSEMEAKEHINRTINCDRCGLSVDIAEDGSTIYSNFVVSESGKIQRKEYNVGLATASRFCAALEYAFSDVSVNAESVVVLAETVVGLVNAPLEVLTIGIDFADGTDWSPECDCDDDRCTRHFWDYVNDPGMIPAVPSSLRSEECSSDKVTSSLEECTDTLNELNTRLPTASKLVMTTVDGPEGQINDFALNPNDPTPGDTIEAIIKYHREIAAKLEWINTRYHHAKCTQHNGT